MKIGHFTNGISCEYSMQGKMQEWLNNKNLEFIDEFYISEVQRRPDFLIIKGGHLINIEAKCNNYDEMMRQLADNAKYCDYSFAFILDCGMTSYDFKRMFLNSGFGLFVFNFDLNIITEVFESHYNRKIDKTLKKTIIGRIRKEIILRRKSKESDNQQKLF